MEGTLTDDPRDASSREVAQGKGFRQWGDGEPDALILELKLKSQ